MQISHSLFHWKFIIVFNINRCEIFYINLQYITPLLFRKPYDLHDTKIIKGKGKLVSIYVMKVCAGGTVPLVHNTVTRRKWMIWRESVFKSFIFPFKGKYLLLLQNSTSRWEGGGGWVSSYSLICHHMQFNNFNVLTIFFVFKWKKLKFGRLADSGDWLHIVVSNVA